MSNESVQQHLLPDAAQSIAQTNKPTEYVVIGLPLEYVQKLDDPIEALVLSRIVHWYMGNGVSRRLKGSPHKWLTKTTAELMAESGIKKEKQIRLALTSLTDHHHLIEVVVGGFRGKKTKFIRLLCANGQSTINGWQEVFNPGASVNLTHASVNTPPFCQSDTCMCQSDTSNSSGDFKGDLDSKPVDEKPSTVSPEIPIQAGKKIQQQQQPQNLLGSVKKPRKLLAWGKTFDEAVTACHGAPKVELPKDQQEIANHNLKLMCRRMLDAQYTPDQVHEFLRWAGGMGWYDLRTEWGSHWHPDTHEKEQVGFRPDIGWLVGNPKKGTGAHRLEAALSIWKHYTEQQPSEPQKQPATPMVNVTHAVDASTPVAPAVVPEPQPVDPRLSVADAWELIERSSAMCPMIEMWRVRMADGVPTPDLAEWLAGPSFTSEKLEIALLLMPMIYPESESVPEPQPEPPVPVECPPVVQVVHVLEADDYQECPEPPEQPKQDLFDQHKEDAARKKAEALAAKSKVKHSKPKSKMLFASKIKQAA